MKKIRIEDIRKVSHIHKLQEFLLQEFSEEKHHTGTFVFEEIYTNISKYAYRPGVTAFVFIASITIGCHSYLFFIDKGRPFDPTMYDPPPPNGKNVGGNGIRLIKTVSKKMDYIRIFGRNCLLIEV